MAASKGLTAGKAKKSGEPRKAPKVAPPIRKAPAPILIILLKISMERLLGL